MAVLLTSDVLIWPTRRPAPKQRNTDAYCHYCTNTDIRDLALLSSFRFTFTFRLAEPQACLWVRYYLIGNLFIRFSLKDSQTYLNHQKVNNWKDHRATVYTRRAPCWATKGPEGSSLLVLYCVHSDLFGFLSHLFVVSKTTLCCLIKVDQKLITLLSVEETNRTVFSYYFFLFEINMKTARCLVLLSKWTKKRVVWWRYYFTLTLNTGWHITQSHLQSKG